MTIQARYVAFIRATKVVEDIQRRLTLVNNPQARKSLAVQLVPARRDMDRKRMEWLRADAQAAARQETTREYA